MKILFICLVSILFCNSISEPDFIQKKGKNIELVYTNEILKIDGILDKKESNRFLKTVQNLRNLKSGQLDKLNIKVRKNKLKQNNKKGIF